MMKLELLTQELINNLQTITTTPCISVYMPTHRNHPENAQDTIRYKNLVKQVRDSLTVNYSTDEINALLKPFDALSEDREFWNHTAEGIAVFGSGDLFRAVNVNVPVDELAIVANSFHTKPLRHYLQSTDRYQVLSLTRDSVNLFEGNRHALLEVALPVDFPTTITKALGEELTEKHTTVASYGGVGRSSTNMHHGHGGKKDELDNDTQRFFRTVAAAVSDTYSNPTGVPLILAALPEHHHLFHQVSKNSLLLKQGIEINPQSVSLDKLTEMAWKVMEPEYVLKLEALGSRFKQAEANGTGSDNLEGIAQAAATGRVDTLLIEENKIMGGDIDTTGVLHPGNIAHPEIDDVLDDLGELVIQQGGKVMIMPPQNMPTNSGVAAIFRY